MAISVPSVSGGYGGAVPAAEHFVGGASGPDKAVDTEEYWPLTKLKEAYMNYLHMKREEIDEAQNARRYRHGAHWTAEQVRVFNQRKQPVVTYNRIGRKVDAIVGLMEKLKQDPKGFPLKPGDELPSELATAVVRSVVISKLRESVFPFCAENGGTEGIGGVEMLLVEQGTDQTGMPIDPEIEFEWVNPDEYFYDPRSYRHAFQDARFQGVAKWMHNDDLKDMLDMDAEEFRGATSAAADFTTNPDREKKWFDTDKDFTRVVDMWYKHKGTWCWCLFTGGKKLMEGKTPFYDGKEPISKYIMYSSFVDHDGDRYGFVRNLVSSQDEINQRRSKGLHELHSRRIKAEDGAFQDVEVARREAVRPDGIIIYTKGFEIEFDDAARQVNIEGQLKFLEDAKNEIENFGPNPALIGQGLEYKSGRAISLLQQAGIAELGPFVINYKNWKLRLYRAIWCAAKRYWKNERWIRVAPFGDAGDEAEFLQINGIQVDQYGIPQLVNHIGELDVSFTLDEGPDEVNMMADAYDTLVALATQGAKIPPDILLELAPLQNSVKKRLLAKYAKAQEPKPEQQMAMQAEIQKLVEEVKKLASETALNQAKVQEILQGNPGEMQMKMLEARQSQEEHQAKMAEMGAKVQMGREQLQIKREEGEIKKAQGLDQLFLKREQGQQQLRLGEAKAEQEMMVGSAQTEQQMRQSEQEHRAGMRRGEEQHMQKVTQAKQQAKQGGKNGKPRTR